MPSLDPLRRSFTCGIGCLALGCGRAELSGSGGPEEAITEVAETVPLVGSIRWDGWTESGATQARFGTAATLYTTYASRKPANWGGDAETVGGGGWALVSTDPANHPVDTAAIMELEIADAKGAIDFFSYMVYPDTPMGQNPTFVSIINQTYYAHALSPHKGDVKRSVTLETAQVSKPARNTDLIWPHLSDWATWLTNEFKDPDYQKVDGKPVLGFFRPVEWAGAGQGGNQNTLSNYRALISMLPPCYLLGFGEISAPPARTLGLHGFTAYDVAAGARLRGNGQHAWVDQVAKDLANAAQSGFDFVATASIRADDRPRLGENSWSWTDPPTPQQQVDAILGFSDAKILMLSAVTEIDEAGGLVRTIQDDDRYLRVTKWARGTLEKPESYTYEIDVRTLLFMYSGSWTRTTDVAGAYDDDEISSSTAGDTVAITCDHTVLMSGTTGSVVITGPTGEDLGTFETLVNGISQGTTSQWGSTAHRVALKSVSVNLEDVVTIKTVSGTVTLDTFAPTVTP